MSESLRDRNTLKERRNVLSLTSIAQQLESNENQTVTAVITYLCISQTDMMTFQVRSTQSAIPGPLRKKTPHTGSPESKRCRKRQIVGQHTHLLTRVLGRRPVQPPVSIN